MIKINKWLIPFSWPYGMAVGMRNWLFDIGVLKSKAYGIPVISVGNITVGGSGKTPHVEYLVKLLREKAKVAVLSRGYKRKTHGYVLAGDDSTVSDIGDEPYQVKQKFPDVYVAVDANRRRGISRLQCDEETSDTDVVILDDAYQHRYVKPGVNILLVDYHRLVIYDRLLPAGRLREPQSEMKRADIIIVTKCPCEMKPMEYRVLRNAIAPRPYQQLFYTTIKYECLHPVFGGEDKDMDFLRKGMNVMLLTGIATPEQMCNDLKEYTEKITPMSFSDHHQFKQKDIDAINSAFEQMEAPKLIITTDKDSVRLKEAEGLSDEVKKAIYTLPIHVEFMLDQKTDFDNNILSYVKKNSRNSILSQAIDAEEKKPKGQTDKSKGSDGNENPPKPHTISFK